MNEHGHQQIHFNHMFKIAVALNLGFVVIEAVFGFLAGSLALLADAGHNLTDVLSLLMAWGARHLTRREPTDRRTYGWRKSSVLAAMFNAIIILVAMGGIAWEAIQRIRTPAPVAEVTIIWVAGVGVLVNTVSAFMFAGGSKTDLNIRGAFLHMAADAGVSMGVVLAGVGILLTGWLWLDPTTSIIVVVFIVAGTWGLLRESLDLAMDAVPRHIDTNDVRAYLSNLPGISGVHDLHIWGLSTTDVALTAHLVKKNPEGDDRLIARIKKELKEQFGIDHITIQWERENELGSPSEACKNNG
jgi:cobalt-zinc-cadmium efflux system protein